MKKLHYLITALIYAAALLSTPESCEGATLHAIVVADTEDWSIGNTAKIDVEKVSEEMTKIADYTDLSLDMLVIKPPYLGADRILNKLNELEIASDDIVIFYYSGHGFRTYDKQTKWPILFLGWNSISLDLFTIASFFEEKNPQFALVMADCCNSYESGPNYKGLKNAGLGEDDIDIETIRENYQHLFLESEGVLLIASSEMGQYSYCNNAFGGFYTDSFLHALQEQTREPNTTWDDLLEDIKQRMTIFDVPQIPIYELLL